MKEYFEPEFEKDAFNCPFCDVYAHQKWRHQLHSYNSSENSQHEHWYDQMRILGWSTSTCSHCSETSFWLKEKLIYPKSSIAPLPNEDMPEDVKEDYLEARNIVNESPRGSCALLRLALQKLMPYLSEKGKNLNDDIKNLVSKGILVEIQQALDSIRVIGNDAVHPGELDLKDDVKTAISLFRILNYIVTNQISSKKEIEMLYDNLPKNKLQGIEDRDK